jgi:hypothetical protein
VSIATTRARPGTPSARTLLLLMYVASNLFSCLLPFLHLHLHLPRYCSPNLTREKTTTNTNVLRRPGRPETLPLQPHFARPIHVLDLRPCRELALDLQGTSCSNSIASSFGLSLAETRCIVPIVVSPSHPAFETASLAAALPSAIAVLLPIALSALSNTCTHPYYIPPRSCALLQSRGCSRHTRSGSAALISPSRIFFCSRPRPFRPWHPRLNFWRFQSRSAVSRAASLDPESRALTTTSSAELR